MRHAEKDAPNGSFETSKAGFLLPLDVVVALVLAVAIGVSCLGGSGVTIGFSFGFGGLEVAIGLNVRFVVMAGGFEW